MKWYVLLLTVLTFFTHLLPNDRIFDDDNMTRYFEAFWPYVLGEPSLDKEASAVCMVSIIPMSYATLSYDLFHFLTAHRCHLLSLSPLRLPIEMVRNLRPLCVFVWWPLQKTSVRVSALYYHSHPQTSFSLTVNLVVGHHPPKTGEHHHKPLVVDNQSSMLLSLSHPLRQSWITRG